jgi:predicted component of type VI protein secretion system
MEELDQIALRQLRSQLARNSKIAQDLKALEICQMRLSKAIRRSTIQPDFVANNCDLFSLKSIRQLAAQKQKLFPS